mgnify:CR=1 FL=1
MGEELRKEYLLRFVSDTQEKTLITFDDLDKLMELLRKSILLSIKSLIQTALFKSNIQFELSIDESIENILELIRSLEIENVNQRTLKK